MERPTASPNVFFDSASQYRWSDLVEREFLERVLEELNEAMEEAFHAFQFFVFSARTPDACPDSLSDPSPRKVLIFITDESGSVPPSLRENYLAIFKLYLPREEPGQNVFPLNLGYLGGVRAGPVKPMHERTTSTFFSGQLHLARAPLYRALHPVYRRLPKLVFRAVFTVYWRGHLRGMEDVLVPGDLSGAVPGSLLRFTRRWRQGLTPEEYGERLADSRIALCPPGIDQSETFRHIEAMRAGAIVVSEPLPDTHFYRGAPIVTVHDWETGVARVRALLADEPALRKLQSQTIEWWETVCSERATARYMKATLETLSASSPSADPA